MRHLSLLLLLISCLRLGGKSDGQKTPFDPTFDPLTNYQWHLKNTGQLNFTTIPGVAGADVNLGNVHDEFKGDGITVAVSDSRIDLAHEDLAANADWVNSKDFTAPLPYTGTPDSSDNTDSHGTAVSSLIAAVKGNGRGGFGLAPGARLIGYNFVISDQSGSRHEEQTKGPAQIFNYSYGSATCWFTDVRSDAVLNSIKLQTLVNDVTYVTAVGNDFVADVVDCDPNQNGTYYGNGNLDQIKSYPYYIVVGAVNAQAQSSDYSAYSSNIWISAPGGENPGYGVMTADLEGCTNGYATSSSAGDFDKNANGLNPNCNYGSRSTIGTSFASPIVSGAIALLKSVDDFNWREIKYILAKTAKYIEPGLSGWITNSAGFKFNSFFGFGLLDVKAAVELAKARSFEIFSLKQTLNDYAGTSSYSSTVLNLAIPDNNTTGVNSILNINRHNLWIEHVQIKISVTHAKSQDLGLYLTSPSGTQSILLVANSGILDGNLTDVTFGSNAFYGERSFGNWTLQVVDRKANDTGTLVKWSIKVLGNKGVLPDILSPAPISGLSNTGNTLSWSASVGPSLLRYEACILPGVTSVCADHDWINLGTVTSKSVTNFSSFTNSALTANTVYNFKIRAIDSSENESTIVEHSWRTSP